MIPSTFSFGCKFRHVPPFCVIDCSGRIYYVVHKFHSMSKIAIHLGVQNHPVMDGKCWESIKETRRLNIEELDCTLDAKIFVISFSVSKTFLADYLFNDSNNGIVELLKGEQLKHIENKFYELSSPNVCNLVASFKRHSGGGYIGNILELKSKNCYDYIQECGFP